MTGRYRYRTEGDICPLCGEGPFRLLTLHATRKHPGSGVSGAIADLRGVKRAILEDRGTPVPQRTGRLVPAAVARGRTRARRARWAVAVAEEVERDPTQWIESLARRWRLTEAGARGRVHILRREGLIPPDRIPRCGKGLHDLSAPGARTVRGICRACETEYQRRYNRTRPKPFSDRKCSDCGIPVGPRSMRCRRCSGRRVGLLVPSSADRARYSLPHGA